MYSGNRFRTLLVVLVSIAAVLSLPAQDVRVDRDELASIGDQSIQFINYVGPHDFVNTLDQIRDIGRSLGTQIRPDRSGSASVGGKYRVIHIVAPEISTGLDADVFILEPDAAVDHINNLRTIIAGYLETAYGFTGRDAFLVAEFVTYYNAVYRGDLDMARSRYKQPVVVVLDPLKMGLDTHYSNWAGATQMLIPLRLAGLRSDGSPVIDTGVISDEKVIDEMRKEEDMGLESRKDMVELREQEIDREQKQIEEQREQVDRREAEVQRELEELEDKEASGQPLTPQEQRAKEDLEEEQEQIRQEQDQIEEEQKEVDERTADVLEMRDEIAEDENLLMREGSGEETFVSAPQVTPVWFLYVDEEKDGIPFGRVMKYNLIDGSRLAVSQVTAVRGRTIAVLPDVLLVIAGMEGANSKVRLMLLDRDTLETRKEGTHDVFPGSLMTVRGSDVYTVTTENGQWRLGKFNTALDRTSVSEVEVEPWTSISFDGTSVFVQSGSGEILKLSASNLREEARLE